jgi:hypothetical protein
MLFNNLKKSKVKYFITPTDNYWHPAVYTDIEKSQPNEVGCPAMKVLSDRLFNINGLMTLDLKFGQDEYNVPYFEYEFDTKEFQVSKENHKSITDMVHVASNNNKASLQHNYGIIFVTDDKDIELTLLGKDGENCYFASGAWNIHSWIRAINAAWIIKDVTKPAYVKTKYAEPLVQVLFNKPVEIEQIEPTNDILNYYKYIKEVSFVKKNISALYETIKNKRPKKLL